MAKTIIPRKFKYKGDVFDDPNPALTPREVAKYFGMKFPELLNGSYQDKGLETLDDEEVHMFELSSSIGTKG